MIGICIKNIALTMIKMSHESQFRTSIGPDFQLGVCLIECNIAHRRCVTVLRMLDKIRLPYPPSSCCTSCMYLMCHRASHAVILLHNGILMLFLAAEPSSTAGLLFASQYLCGTILVTLWGGGDGLYSILWDWRVLRAGVILFWP